MGNSSRSIAELGLKPEEIPNILLPYQQRWLKDKSAIKLWSKSRRIGASWAEAADCALLASQAKGQNCFYIGYEKEMARGFIEDCANWAKAYGAAASEIYEGEEVFRDKDSEKSIQVFRINFNSGYKVEALSSKPRNMRSRQGRVVIDEAAFHDDLPGLLKAAKALRIWGSSIHLITTYNCTEEPYYELEKDVLSGKLPYSRHFTTFDDALAEGLYQRICLVSGIKWTVNGEKAWRQEIFSEFGDDADEELLCIPRKSGGSFFPRILVESVMHRNIPVLKLQKPDSFALLSEAERYQDIQLWLDNNASPILDRLNSNLRSYYGMDFGRSGDVSYLLVLQELTNLTRRAPFAIELRNIPFKNQEQILFFICDRLLPNLAQGAMDARGNGQYLAEVAAQRYGSWRVQQVMLSADWYTSNMPKYKAALEDKKVVLPLDADLLQDHRDVIVDRGVPKVADKKRKGSDGKQRHGDGAIACALAWYAASQEVNLIEPDFSTDPDLSFWGWE